MVERASLESLYTGNCIEGSNPSVSADKASNPCIYRGFCFFIRDPVGIRTPNLLIRSEVLYPVELRNLKLGYKYTIFYNNLMTL